MKKVITSCCLLFILGITIADARPINEQRAKQVALNFMSEKSGRLLATEDLTTAFIEKINSDTVYYVVNFSQGGWAVISADDVAYPIVAFSYQGMYSTQNHPVQFDQWMENVTNEIHTAITQKAVSLPETEMAWNRLNVSTDSFNAKSLSYSVAPLLTTTWDQGAYYNASCPVAATGPGGHVWAGCVATAMAQVMKYHNYPATGVGSHSYVDDTYGTQSADFEATSYDWASMPNVLSGHNTDVATLLYHAGVSVDMDYGVSGSGANVSYDATNALKTYFKYNDGLYFASKSDYTDNEWQDLLHTELNNGRPILYRGSGTGGHAFVCDGFSNDDYFHFNWGWSGWYNGYFYLNDLTPTEYNFTNDQGGIMGITPSVDPSLTYTYFEGFENGLPSEMDISGSYATIVGDTFHGGSNSLRLNSSTELGSTLNVALLNINVPSQGAQLSFWVKRGYDPGASSYNQQTAWLETQFGSTVLHSFYDGDYNDSHWVQFTLDLLPWAGSNIKLVIEQYRNSSSWLEWTYLDDIEITTTSDRGFAMPAILFLLLNK